MKLSKDRQIQILLAIAIVILLIVIASISKNGKDDILEFGETLTEEIETENKDAEEIAPVNANTEKTITTATTAPATKPSSGGCYPNLSAKKLQMPAAIQLAWTKCDSEDFQFYKLVKSATNSNPNFPSDGVILSSTNNSVTSYLDQTVAKNMTYYYRVCVVQRLNKITCSNVASMAY